MKLKRFIYFLLFFLPFQGIAQERQDLIITSLAENDITKNLPSLDSLMFLAEQNSPLLNYYDAGVLINRLKVITQKRDWMEYLAFESSVRYGLFDNLILKEALGTQDLATATTEQTRYALGVAVRVPLSRIYDRKNKIAQANTEMERARLEQENTRKELRQLVIVQYNNVVKAHRMMIISNARVTSFEVQVIRAEKDFVNGKINIAEMARLQEMFASAFENFEANKSDFQLAYLLLQETVGTKLKPLEN